jgi:Arc/MetJ family transcription regulator
MTGRKTSVELDVQLLSKVKQALGTATIKETVEAAFMEVLRARARREEVEALAEMKGMDLDNAEVMSRAWGE